MNRLDKILEQARGLVQLIEAMADEQERLAEESRNLLFGDEKESPRPRFVFDEAKAEWVPSGFDKDCPYHHTLCRCRDCLACGCDHHKWLRPAQG